MRPTPLAPELRPAAQNREPAFSSMPPTQQRKPVAVPTPAGSIAGGDSFVGPPQRPLGLIAIVLVIDLALGGAGAVMLSRGLSAKKIKDEPAPAKAPQMQQRSEVTQPPPPPPTPVPSPSPSEAVANASPSTKLPASASSLVEANTDKTPTRTTDKPTDKPDAKKKSTKGSASTTTKGGTDSKAGTTTKGSGTAGASGPVTHPGGGPEDPYKEAQPAGGGGFDLKAEANKLASGSNELFARCRSAAGTVHGTIKVAYRVEADGRVGHPFAVENSTGNEQLGTCLADVIATWHFSPHTGDGQNAVRPFTYP